MNNMSSVAAIYALENQTNIPHNALDYICAQTLKPHQLIIVYRTSQAQAIAPLQSHIKETLPALQPQYIECSSDDVRNTRNIALDYIKDCQYIHFVDADIKLAKDFYEKATLDLAKSTNCVAVVPAHLELLDEAKTKIDLSKLIENPLLWLMRSKLEIAGIILLRRDAVERAGKFNPLLALGKDTDFYARICNQGSWCYIKDCAATRSYALCKADTQAQFPDYHRRWALIYENLLDTYRARDQIPRKVYRSILAESWRSAGRELLNHGRIEEAHDCFMRSLSWRVINPSLKYLIKISRLRKTLATSKTPVI